MKVYNWNKVETLSLDDLEENKLTEVEVADKRVGLLKRNNKVFAFAAKCPHAGVPLCGGWVDAMGRVVCPEHKYRFDPENGRNTSGEGYRLYTYGVELMGNDIFVGFVL
jgi:3-phenylpropionate/trans-cinnamate dioxygenase ferredoxin subunit